MIIPVNETVIYIQPIYLQSTGGSSIPELRRVIVATQDTVYMGNTLADALLGALNGSGSSTTGAAAGSGADTGGNATGTTAPSTDIVVVVQQANDAYERGQTALASGDWAAYGQAQSDLATALGQLEALTGNGTPVASPETSATPAP